MAVGVVRSMAGHRLEGEGPVVAVGNRFLDQLRTRGFSPATVRGYAYDLANFDRFLTEVGVGLAEVAPTDLFGYLDWQAGGRRSGDKLVAWVRGGRRRRR